MSLDRLITLQGKANIAEDLTDEELNKIGSDVIQESELDEKSMAEWLDRIEDAMKIALQIVEPKNFPWPNASNVKFPLIANGAITFAAREYPQVVRGNRVVEAATFGKDPDQFKLKRSKRISNHMSWQLLVDSDSWESDTDKLLVMLAVIGTVFRKAYYDPINRRPVFELCRPDHILINNNVKSLESARRITHKMTMYSNDIIERMRSGIFSEIDIKELEGGRSYHGGNVNDPDSPHHIYEQHRFLDLDEDGYQEPYIVTVHKDTKKVLRIVSRFDLDGIDADSTKKIRAIRPNCYFTDFHFFPSPDGKYLSLGLGTLLAPLNSSINVLINQLLDSGTLANSQPIIMGGGSRIKAGDIKLEPGTITKIPGPAGMDIKNSLMPLPVIPPSPVLFQMLGLMIDTGKELASISDILQGKQPTQNSPATSVLALIKQGLVQYNAIHKRVLRSFKVEFSKLYKMNHDYLDIEKYLTMIDDPEASADDYGLYDLDIKPIADPNVSSEVQRMARAEMILQVLGPQNVNAVRMYLEAADVEQTQIDMLSPLPPPDAPPPPEVQKILAEVQEIQAKVQLLSLEPREKAVDFQLREREVNKKEQEFALKVKEVEALIRNLEAQNVELFAKAEKAREEAKHAGDKPPRQNN